MPNKVSLVPPVMKTNTAAFPFTTRNQSNTRTVFSTRAIELTAQPENKEELKSFITNDLEDWEAKVATSLYRAVPADVNKTIITLNRHELIIERQDFTYRLFATIENALIIASSLFLIGISGSAVLYALNAVGVSF